MNRIYEENSRIQDGIWNVNNLVEFEVEIQDTASSANMYINVRNSGAYPYSNLFLFVTTMFPNGKKRKDTSSVIAGDIAAVLKLKNTHTNDTLADSRAQIVLPKIQFPNPKTSSELRAQSSALGVVLDYLAPPLHDPNH